MRFLQSAATVRGIQMTVNPLTVKANSVKVNEDFGFLLHICFNMCKQNITESKDLQLFTSHGLAGSTYSLILSDFTLKLLHSSSRQSNQPIKVSCLYFLTVYRPEWSCIIAAESYLQRLTALTCPYTHSYITEPEIIGSRNSDPSWAFISSYLISKSLHSLI